MTTLIYAHSGHIAVLKIHPLLFLILRHVGFFSPSPCHSLSPHVACTSPHSLPLHCHTNTSSQHLITTSFLPFQTGPLPRSLSRSSFLSSYSISSSHSVTLSRVSFSNSHWFSLLPPPPPSLYQDSPSSQSLIDRSTSWFIPLSVPTLIVIYSPFFQFYSSTKPPSGFLLTVSFDSIHHSFTINFI